MKKIFVCSPLRGAYSANLILAKQLCRAVVYMPERRPELPSAGMRYEIDLANRAGIKVVFNPPIWEGL